MLISLVIILFIVCAAIIAVATYMDREWKRKVFTLEETHAAKEKKFKLRKIELNLVVKQVRSLKAVNKGLKQELESVGIKPAVKKLGKPKKK